jgi:radical SAM protein with 4Fe4S-binding SPASM domain
VNGTSLEIADLLDKGQSPEETAHHLTARYGIPLDSARKDVLFVKEELRKQQFFAETSRAPSPRSPSINSIFLHITKRCNLSCKHCYVVGPPDSDLPVSLILRMIDEVQDHRCSSVTLSGGEPLLHPEIRTILSYASHKTKLQILTNGTLITKEMAALLGEAVSAIQISVDGSAQEIHDAIRGEGSFDRTMTAVERLQKAGLADRITLSTTIMRQNLHDLPDVIALAERLGIPSVRFLPLRKSGRAHALWHQVGSGLRAEHSERFYQFVLDLQQRRRYGASISCGLSGFLLKPPVEQSDDEYWCPVGKKLVVDGDGNIYPCVLLMEDDFLLGNAFHQGLGEVLHSDRMLELCSALCERRTKIPKCSQCLWRNLCQSGCMGQAFDHCGTIWETDHFCDFRNRAYQGAFDRILQGM